MNSHELFSCLTGDLDYPMLVLTAADGVERAGCLVGFWTQCSINPQRLLVCVSEVNRTYQIIFRTGIVVAHFLGRENTALAKLFGEKTGDEVDKFLRCRWTSGPGGAPVLEDCSHWISGEILERVNVGDHTALFLKPSTGRCERWQGQLGYQAIRGIAPGHPV